jgi:uncharacterized protein with PIN domain
MTSDERVRTVAHKAKPRLHLVRCRTCNKVLGERSGARLIIRKIGLTLRGGIHTWDCPKCGRRQTVDLDGS